ITTKMNKKQQSCFSTMPGNEHQKTAGHHFSDQCNTHLEASQVRQTYDRFSRWGKEVHIWVVVLLLCLAKEQLATQQAPVAPHPLCHRTPLVH
uniref:Uncharacterized protein n=1 Tax=Scleropages formosus TaxID=113540 RepID=A0A8C9QZP5_SCLFO